MLVLHAGRGGFLIVFELVEHGVIDVHVTDNGFDILAGDNARAQDTGRVGDQRNDGALHADGARAAVEDGFDPALHVVDDVLGGSGAGLARGVRGGRGERQTACQKQAMRVGVGRNTHGDRVEPRADFVGDHVALLHDDGQRSRPESVG